MSCCSTDFPGHKTHVRTAHGFADRLRVIGVVLVGLYKGFDELRGNEPNAPGSVDVTPTI